MRNTQGFPPDPKYAGRLLKANCAARPKGCSACFVPQTHYEMHYVEPILRCPELVGHHDGS